MARTVPPSSACSIACCPSRATSGFPPTSPHSRATPTRARNCARCSREVRSMLGGVDIMAPPGMEEMQQQLQSVLSNLGGNRTRTRRVKVREALKLMIEEEAAKLINEEELKARALTNAEQNGIVFIDEIDKIARRQE